MCATSCVERKRTVLSLALRKPRTEVKIDDVRRLLGVSWNAFSSPSCSFAAKMALSGFH
jgi:hypothetical protein